MKYSNTVPDLNIAMSAQELAKLGENNVAYIRSMSSNDLMEKFPAVEGLEPNQSLWALFAADGNPLALSDQIGGVLSNAHDLDLHPVTLQ